jgi:azurin
MKKYTTILLISAMGFWSACSSSSNDKETKQEEKKPETEEKVEAKEAPADTAYLEITSNDEMKFNLSELKAKAGQTVVLKLSHIGEMPKETMGHNWILLQKDVAMAKFATAAIKEKDTDYIPADAADQIIAHTKLLGGGEDDTITFQAPESGTYTYLCSFPGHFGMMNGKFIVE